MTPNISLKELKVTIYYYCNLIGIKSFYYAFIYESENTTIIENEVFYK